MVGDGSYLMMNSEIATSVMLGQKLIIVVARQSRLRLHQPPAEGDRRRAVQQPVEDARHAVLPEVDFVAHARSLGAERRQGRLDRRARGRVRGRARGQRPTQVIVIDTDPIASTDAGGLWWDVAVPAVSTRAEVGRRPRGLRRSAGDPAASETEDEPYASAPTPSAGPMTTCRNSAATRRSRPAWPRPRRPASSAWRRATSCPRDGGGARRTSSPSSGSIFVGGWYSAELLRALAEEEFEAARRHIAMTKGAGADVVVFAETSNCIHGDRSKPLSRAPGLKKGDWADLGAQMTEFAERWPRGAASSATTITWERSSSRSATSTPSWRTPRPPVHLLLDTGHARWGGADPAALARRYRERISHVHCKDVREAKMRESTPATGASSIPSSAGRGLGVYTVPGDGVSTTSPCSRSCRAIPAGSCSRPSRTRKRPPLTYARMG